MSDSDETTDRRNGKASSRPLFDPARDRAIERERARERQSQANGSKVWSRSRSRPAESSTPTDRKKTHRRSSRSSRKNASGLGETTGSSSGSRFASAPGVTGRGIGITLVTALFCVLGYYGILGVRDVGLQVFGSVVPAPFYALVLSVLFVFSLVPRAHQGLWALGWATGFAVVFGGLFTLGVEGLLYLAEDPSVLTADYSGLVVLALALVVSSVAYWGVLRAAKAV